jgi:uncharacterized protein with NRDE domain
MCLLFVAWHPESHRRIIVAANRDELHQRPALPAGPWIDAPHVIGGRDLQGGGSWLGIAQRDRFCALTNFREPNRRMLGAPSRGVLVSEYLQSPHDAEVVLADLLDRIDAYPGFNLLAADAERLWLLSNRPKPSLRLLPPGLYGISNGTLDAAWPKVRRGKDRLEALLKTGSPPIDALFELLADTRVAPDDELPQTGLDLAWERLLSPAFIRDPRYGTRCSTLVFGEGRNPLRLIERRFDAEGRRNGESDWTFTVDGRPVQVRP